MIYGGPRGYCSKFIRHNISQEKRNAFTTAVWCSFQEKYSRRERIMKKKDLTNLNDTNMDFIYEFFLKMIFCISQEILFVELN